MVSFAPFLPYMDDFFYFKLFIDFLNSLNSNLLSQFFFSLLNKYSNSTHTQYLILDSFSHFSNSFYSIRDILNNFHGILTWD